MLPDAVVTARETNTGGVTFRVADAVTAPEVAVTVAVPVARPVARPVLLRVATAVAEEVQFAELVRFCVLPSE